MAKSKKYIDVIGVDNRLHIAEIHKSNTLCGIKIKSKKPTKKDIVSRFNCYKCSF